MFKHLLSVRLNPVQLTWVAAMFFTTAGNIMLWQTLWGEIGIFNLHSFLFFTSLPVFLFCFINLLLTPFMVLPYIRTPLLALLITISASCSHFMLRYHIVIDRSMVKNFFETNQAELKSYFSFQLLFTVFFLGVVPAFAILYLPVKKFESRLKSFSWWLGHIAVTLTLLATVTMVFYKDYASLLQNNMQIKDQALPFNFVCNTNRYLKGKLNAKSKLMRTLAKNVSRHRTTADEKLKRMIVDAGETARRQHSQLNDYPRPTHSVLSHFQDEISFKNVAFCGTATAISLPYMSSRLLTLFEWNHALDVENRLPVEHR